MFPPARLCAACACGFALATLAAAQQVAPKEAEKQLADAITAFEKAKVAADEKATTAFAKLVATAEKSPTITAAARPEVVEKCQKAMDRFVQKRDWPNDPSIWEYLDGKNNGWGYRRELDYNAELARAFNPVSKGYEKAIKAYRAAGDDAAVMRLLGERVRLIETHFPGRAGFTSGTVWTGNRVGQKGGLTALRLNLRGVKDTTFEGVVRQTSEKGTERVYEVKGEIHGNQVAFNATKAVKGEAPDLNFAGYLSNGRMFLEVTGKSVKEKSVHNYAVLDHQGVAKKKGKN